MLIDWFTVGAEVINFVILMWLLKRFLYQPILDAIDAREQKIAAELADAASKKAEAQKEREEFQHKNEEFDQQRAALMSKATDEVKAERIRLLDEARQAADSLRARRQDALAQEYQGLNTAITRLTREEVFAIARKTLSDLAAASLEERICDVFTQRVREMDNEAKEGFANALKGTSTPVQVRSAFELPSQQRDSIQRAINEALSADVPIHYEIASDVVSGVELTTNGRKIAWSIADYLASMETKVAELLKKQSTPPVKPDSKAEAHPQPETKPASTLEAK